MLKTRKTTEKRKAPAALTVRSNVEHRIDNKRLSRAVFGYPVKTAATTSSYSFGGGTPNSSDDPNKGPGRSFYSPKEPSFRSLGADSAGNAGERPATERALGGGKSAG